MPVRLEPPDAIAAFFDELKRTGFVEGKNLTYEVRAFAPHPERMSEYAAEIVKAVPDIILADSATIPALQEATKTIPILGFDLDLVGSGLVNSMAHPNGDVTGLAFISNELDGKRQEILIEAVPGIRKMAALADAKQRDNRLDALKEAARARNIELSIYRVASGEEIAAAIDAAKASGADALNILFERDVLRLSSNNFRARLGPAIASNVRSLNGRGRLLRCLWSTWAHLATIYARQAIQLLRGTKVVDVPVEQPFKLELVINLKTANAMGVTVPAALLARADKVIE
jgi:putative tryptophan/tyrosine transport system substrate-binding protein